MNKFVIWGHKLKTNPDTYSYVLYGYAKAAKFLGYDVHWIDHSDALPEICSEDIIFTEGRADSNVPLIKNAKYLLHHCNNSKYADAGCRVINLCNYVEPCERGISLNYGEDSGVCAIKEKYGKVYKIRDFCFYDEENKAIYQPWATDLLPYEIDENNPIMYNPSINDIYYVGYVYHDNILPKFQIFSQCCQKNGKNIVMSQGNVSFEDNKRLIQNSYITVDIRGDWHQQCGYIPCRIWKNLSYGKFIGTNSPPIGNILKDYIAYDNDLTTLYSTVETAYANISKEKMIETMKYVKENHTYINRLKNILELWGDI